MTLNPWFVWVDLERREKQEYRAAERARGQGPRWNLDHYWILESPFPGWRVQKLHSALQSTNWRVGQRLAERLDGLDVKAIAQALAETCQDIALVWGGSALLGAGAGAVLGSLAGGVGALPGAALGAGVGTQVGAWVLGMLGLAGLLQDLGDQVPRALRHYAAGLELAWGQYNQYRSKEPDTFGAADEIAEGHVLLATAVLSALAAWLTRGRGDLAARARLLLQLRQNPRLGAGLADWVAAHEDQLIAHPGLRPRRPQVTTMAAAPAKDVGPAVTPGQLRRLREAGPQGAGQPPGAQPTIASA